MLRMAVAAYTFESKARGTSKWKGKKTLILAACALGYVENTEERCRKHREIYLGTQLVNCRCTHTHTPTHFITYDRFKAQHIRKGQQKCDVYSLRNGCDPLISWLPHTVRAEPRAACTVVQLARSSKK